MSEISKRMIMIMDIYRWVVALGGGGATGAHFFIQQTFSIKFERAHPHPPPNFQNLCYVPVSTVHMSEVRIK